MSKIPKSRYIKRNKFNIQRRNLSRNKSDEKCEKTCIYVIFGYLFFFICSIGKCAYAKNRPLT